MSGVRTHFCTLTARLYGGVSSPRKNGLNGTIPAFTNSRLGSGTSSDAEGTAWWPAASKCATKRRRISAVSMTSGSPVQWWCRSWVEWDRTSRWWRAERRRASRDRPTFELPRSVERPAEPVPQLGLLLGHAGAHLLGEEVGPQAESGDPVAQAFGRERLGGPTCLDHRVDARAGAGDEPESPVHRDLTLRRRWASGPRGSRPGPAATRPSSRGDAACGRGAPPGVPRTGSCCGTRPTAPGAARGRRRPP